MRSRLFKLALMLVCATALAMKPTPASAGDCGDCGIIQDGTIFQYNFCSCTWTDVACWMGYCWWGNDCQVCGWSSGIPPYVT